MEQEDPTPDGDEDAADGTAAVLYAIFTSFTESLGELEHRLAAIEAAVQRPVPESAEASQAEVRALSDLVDRRADAIERRLAAMEEALVSLRALLQLHADDTAHSLGRRAGEVGRRLASDLGLRTRRGETGRDP